MGTILAGFVGWPLRGETVDGEKGCTTRKTPIPGRLGATRAVCAPELENANLWRGGGLGSDLGLFFRLGSVLEPVHDDKLDIGQLGYLKKKVT